MRYLEKNSWWLSVLLIQSAQSRKDLFSFFLTFLCELGFQGLIQSKSSWFCIVAHTMATMRHTDLTYTQTPAGISIYLAQENQMHGSWWCRTVSCLSVITFTEFLLHKLKYFLDQIPQYLFILTFLYHKENNKRN